MGRPCSVQLFILSEKRGDRSECTPADCLLFAEEPLDLIQIGGPAVAGQAFEKNLPVLLLHDPVVEQAEQATVMERTDETSKALFQSNHCRWHLILKKCVP